MVLKPRIILFFNACVADTTVDNLNGIRTLLPDVLITLFINGKQTVINGSGSLPRNKPYFFLLQIFVFDRFILTKICKTLTET